MLQIKKYMVHFQVDLCYGAVLTAAVTANGVRVFRRNDLYHQETARDESSCCCLQTCWLSDAINNTGKIVPLKLLPSGSFEVQSWDFLHTSMQINAKTSRMCFKLRVYVSCWVYVWRGFLWPNERTGWFSHAAQNWKFVWLPNVIYCAKCVFSTTQEGQLTFTLNKQNNKLLPVTIVHEVPSVTIIKIFCWVHFCCSFQIKRSLHTPPLLFLLWQSIKSLLLKPCYVCS